MNRKSQRQQNYSNPRQNQRNYAASHFVSGGSLNNLKQAYPPVQQTPQKPNQQQTATPAIIQVQPNVPETIQPPKVQTVQAPLIQQAVQAPLIQQAVQAPLMQQTVPAPLIQQSVPIVPSVAPKPPTENIAKTEPMESAQDNSDKMDDSTTGDKPYWHRIKGKKIPSHVRRSRHNRRLRKLLTPKSALMALNELSGTALSEYVLTVKENGFKAEVLVNGVQYDGFGSSKTGAKNAASEKALRDQIIQKMLTAPKSVKTTELPKDLNNDVVMDDGQSHDEAQEENEIPMIHLASYALYKLFNEWQQEGYEVPDFKHPESGTGGPGNSVGAAGDNLKKGFRTELPANAINMHPTMLLLMMRPNVQYITLGAEGQAPNILHKVGVTVDEQSFVGVSRKVKIARKNAAIEACNHLFGTTFQIEVLPDIAPPNAAKTKLIA